VNAYDESNPLNNLFKMHQRVKKEQEAAKEIERERRRIERAKKNEELKEKIEETKEKQEKKASGELKEPPMMDTIMNFLGGFKLELKRIHIRYEDDYFQHHRPFSFGFMIESLSLDNSDTDWIFQAPLSILINKNRPEYDHYSLNLINFFRNTVIKELQIRNIKLYWNSMSEIFIPTSLWE
jgi:Vacuolar sorting-associated protein 13, N-terminal